MSVVIVGGGPNLGAAKARRACVRLRTAGAGGCRAGVRRAGSSLALERFQIAVELTDAPA